MTLLQTPSLQPLYFNFHASREEEDSFDKKVLGNTRIIGQAGSGKTALMNFLLSQAQKYRTGAPQGFATAFFDKDRVAELAIRAIGGRYLADEGKFVVSTPLGRELVDMLPLSLTDPATTAVWEERLDQLRQGALPESARDEFVASSATAS